MTWNDLECPIQLNVHMSHGLLADSVDTSLASLLYSCTTDTVFTEVHTISERAEKDVTCCPSAVAELLVHCSTGDRHLAAMLLNYLAQYYLELVIAPHCRSLGQTLPSCAKRLLKYDIFMQANNDVAYT